MERELAVKTELKVGRSGEFTVWVDGALVAEKRALGFPSELDIVEAVRKALGVQQP